MVAEGVHASSASRRWSWCRSSRVREDHVRPERRAELVEVLLDLRDVREEPLPEGLRRRRSLGPPARIAAAPARASAARTSPELKTIQSTWRPARLEELEQRPAAADLDVVAMSAEAQDPRERRGRLRERLEHRSGADRSSGASVDSGGGTLAVASVSHTFHGPFPARDLLERLLLLQRVHRRPEPLVCWRTAADLAASRTNGSSTSSSPVRCSRRSPAEDEVAAVDPEVRVASGSTPPSTTVGLVVSTTWNE